MSTDKEFLILANIAEEFKCISHAARVRIINYLFDWVAHRAPAQPVPSREESDFKEEF